MTEETEVKEAEVSGKPSGGNKLIVVVVVVILLLAIAGFAAQMVMRKASTMVGQKIGEQAVETMIESSVGGNADVDLGNNSMTVKTDEGTFSTGASLPENFPSDVPIYPGSSVTYSGTNTPESGESGFAAMLTTPDGYQDVGSYYTRELPGKGWTITGTQSVSGTTVITATKESRSVSVAASTGDGTTTITLGVNQE